MRRGTAPNCVILIIKCENVSGIWRAFKPVFLPILIDFWPKIVYNYETITGFAGGQDVVIIAFSLSRLSYVFQANNSEQKVHHNILKFFKRR